MAVKVNSLKDEDIRKIGDAFADHEYAEAEWGMGYLAKNRQASYNFLVGALKSM